jgi:hypothetical protein
VPFDFSLEVEFVYDPNFSLPAIPLSLDLSFYALSLSYYHFHESFFFDETRHLSFNVTQRSFMRAAATGANILSFRGESEGKRVSG